MISTFYIIFKSKSFVVNRLLIFSKLSERSNENEMKRMRHIDTLVKRSIDLIFAETSLDEQMEETDTSPKKTSWWSYLLPYHYFA